MKNNNIIIYELYKSYTGDWFKIPVDMYEQDVLVYRKALRDGDEKTMIKLESGETGWKYYEPHVL